jgi:hypothetical protein
MTRAKFYAFVTCDDDGKAVRYRRPTKAAAEKLVRELNAVFKRHNMDGRYCGGDYAGLVSTHPAKAA